MLTDTIAFRVFWSSFILASLYRTHSLCVQFGFDQPALCTCRLQSLLDALARLWRDIADQPAVDQRQHAVGRERCQNLAPVGRSFVIRGIVLEVDWLWQDQHADSDKAGNADEKCVFGHKSSSLMENSSRKRSSVFADCFHCAISVFRSCHHWLLSAVASSTLSGVRMSPFSASSIRAA